MRIPDQIKRHPLATAAGLGAAFLLTIRGCPDEKPTTVDPSAENFTQNTPYRSATSPSLNDPEEPKNPLETLQNQLAEEVRQCIIGTAPKQGLEVDCDLVDQKVSFPEDQETDYKVQTVRCTTYEFDEETQTSHPVAQSYSYIGRLCDPEDYHCSHPDDVTFGALSTSLPLNRYADSDLPSLGLGQVDFDGSADLTEKNSSIVAFADDLESLTSNTDETCSDALRFLSETTPLGDQAYELSRSLLHLEDQLARAGFKFNAELAVSDERLFTSLGEVSVYGISEKGVPLECRMTFGEDGETVACGRQYGGLFNADGNYFRPDGLTQNSEDHCSVSGSLNGLPPLDTFTQCSTSSSFYFFPPSEYDSWDRACSTYHTYQAYLNSGEVTFWSDTVAALYQEHCN